MRRFPAVLVCTLAVGPMAIHAQDRLDPTLRDALAAVLADARRDSLPVAALEGKALEGQAKSRPASQIVAVVTQLAGDMRAARALLRGEGGGPSASADEIVAAADALHQGVPPDAVRDLRRDAPTGANLSIALAVLGSLIARGVPADHAAEVVRTLVQGGTPAGRLIELPGRLDHALAGGGPPAAALGNVLRGMNLPVPPGPANRPGRRPRG